MFSIEGDEVKNNNRWLTIQPAPCPYANFCASAHFFRNSSVAENWVDNAHSKRLTNLAKQEKRDAADEKYLQTKEDCSRELHRFGYGWYLKVKIEIN